MFLESKDTIYIYVYKLNHLNDIMININKQLKVK